MPPASTPLPALSLIAVPGRRSQTLETAREIEARGFPGIFVPSPFGGMALCEALALATRTIKFATSIAPIYFRTVEEYAHSAAFTHEISGGRFLFGIGISHGPTLDRMGIKAGKPLADIRSFVERYRAVEGTGAKAPVVLATLRRRMIGLAAEIGDGMVFANGSRSHMAESLGALPAAKRSDPNFFIGNMIPTCISDDIEAAKAVNRKTLTRYAMLPNYNAYWAEAGYAEEMAAVRAAMAKGDTEAVPKILHDRWLADSTLFGPASRVRDELARWYDAGIRTPILVPSSAAGNQMKAIQEVFDCFAR